MQVHSCEFCDEISKCDYLVVHLRPADTDILGYPSVDILCKVHIKGMYSSLQDFGIYLFQIDFRILHNLRGLFRTISNICDAEMLR